MSIDPVEHGRLIEAVERLTRHIDRTTADLQRTQRELAESRAEFQREFAEMKRRLSTGWGMLLGVALAAGAFGQHVLGFLKEMFR